MASERVAVVADSTLALPQDLAAEAGIRVVPVHVVADGEPRREGLDIRPGEVARLLRAGARLTTSRPSPQEFLAAFREEADHGATAVVSVHLSSELSGTAESARLAARSSPIPVNVVDTRLVAMGGGFAALDAAAAASSGAGANEVARAAMDTAGRSALFFYVDTLEYLRRGGRIGAAQRYLGAALRVKPLLTMSGGEVTPLEKVRTAAKALARIVEIAAQAGERFSQPRVAVHHLEAPDAAVGVADALRQKLGVAEVLVVEIGAVIGVHVGPGVVAVAVAPNSP